MTKLVDLYLAGIGFGEIEQMTIQTRAILKCCRIVFHLTQQHNKLQTINPNTIDLGESYWTGEPVNVVYDRLFKIIMNEVKRGPGVASVGEGHPLFFDDCHMRLLRTCKRNGLLCRVLPAISCLDTICIDLGIDYGDCGLQVFETTSMVEGKLAMNPHVHTLLLQVGEFGTDITPDHVKTKKGMFRPLERYLQRFYSRNHRAVVCFTQCNGFAEFRFSTRIGRLDYHRRQIVPGTTLYLPPIK